MGNTIPPETLSSIIVMGDVEAERGNDSWKTSLSYHRTSIVDTLKLGAVCLTARCADGRRGRFFHLK